MAGKELYRINLTVVLPNRAEREMPITAKIIRDEEDEHARQRRARNRGNKKGKPGVSLKKISNNLVGFTLIGVVPERRDGKLNLRMNFVRTDMVTGPQKIYDDPEVQQRQEYFRENRAEIWRECSDLLSRIVGRVWHYDNPAEIEGYRAIVVMMDDVQDDEDPDYFLTLSNDKPDLVVAEA